MSRAPSITGRVFVAVALLVGFYVLALGIAAGLFYIPYAEWKFVHRIHPKLALVCVGGGLIVLWSALPRWDRFVAPGPRLKREQQPKLFDELESVAKATGQAMPSEVYLVGEVNAWVAQRGGVLGFGSRRVMGLGLPLLRVLSRAEMRGVLAHEFGHFHGGDTKLGPLIYRTRSAIERTVVAMAQADASLLQTPFRWYGKLFLRSTHAISRRQELAADALAARVAGAHALIGGLRTTRGAAQAFQSFWRNECSPVLEAVFLPPLSEGFASFLGTKGVAEAVERIVSEDIERAEKNPYDTHPPLAERIVALEEAESAGASATRASQTADAAPALSLLKDVPELEAAWLQAAFPSGDVNKLERVGWTDVGRVVYLPEWKRRLGAQAKAFAGMKGIELHARLSARDEFVRSLDTKGVPSEHLQTFAIMVGEAALGLALRERGATIEALPGLAITLRSGAETLEPGTLACALADGKMPADEWRTFCERHGIADVDLGALAERAGSPPSS